MNKKVKYKNKIEFVNYVADDCLKNMSSEDKEYLIEKSCGNRISFFILFVY